MTIDKSKPFTKAQEEAHATIDQIWKEMVIQLKETSDKLAELTGDMVDLLEDEVVDDTQRDIFEDMSEGEIADRISNMDTYSLGDLFKDYFNESVHNNWDGHLLEEREAYYTMFRDMLRFNHNLGPKK